MTRLIDTLTEVELSSKVMRLYSGSLCNLRQGLEALFAKEPHWSAGLDPKDDQSWVLCYLSDDSPVDRRRCAWVMRHNGSVYMTSRLNGCWKYATPVDLNVRFRKGDE